MDRKQHHNRIDYVEMKVTDIAAAKGFYSSVFGWPFTDWGDAYASFNDGQLDGGLEQSAEPGGALVVLYSTDLDNTRQEIVDAGGTIVRETFEFPGGRRFHFTDPGGNELAVWSER